MIDKREDTSESIFSPDGKERKKTTKNHIVSFGKSLMKNFIKSDKEPRKSRLKSPMDES